MAVADDDPAIRADIDAAINTARSTSNIEPDAPDTPNLIDRIRPEVEKLP
jgi:hypothetical protein